MAEIAVPNLKTFFYVAPESAQFPNADLTDGMNRGGSCSPGVGINTGDYDPKVSDWSQHARDSYSSQNIGGTPAQITVDQDPDFNDQVSFIQTDGVTAPDEEMAVGSGVFNKTGKTIPASSWAWGLKPVA